MRTGATSSALPTLDGCKIDDFILEREIAGNGDETEILLCPLPLKPSTNLAGWFSLSVSIIVFRSILVSYEHQQRRTEMQMVSVSVFIRPSVAVCDSEPYPPHFLMNCILKISTRRLLLSAALIDTAFSESLPPPPLLSITVSNSLLTKHSDSHVYFL